MALVRPFFTREKEDGTSQVFSLARDVLTDRVFILQGSTMRDSAGLRYEETMRSIADFLGRDGVAQSELLALIGTLVVEA